MSKPRPRPRPLSASGRRALIITEVIFVCAVLWMVGFFASMGMTVLQNKACGLDPMTGYETEECAPISALDQALFFVWLFAPVGCALLGAMITMIPRRMRRTRLTALWLVPLWPLSVVAGAVLTYELYWPLSD